MESQVKKVVLVTGATGFVGKNLVRLLAENGYIVNALARESSNTASIAKYCNKIYTGDIKSRPALDQATAGCDMVFHLASMLQGAEQADSEFWNVHVEGTRNVFEASIANNVPVVVHCSTIGVLGSTKGNVPDDETSPYNATDIYQVTKCEAEKLALEYYASGKVRGNVIRPASIFGPGDFRLLKLFRSVARKRFVMIGKGKKFIHFVYVKDLARAIMTAGQKADTVNGEVFIIAAKRYLALREFIGIIASKSGGRLPRFYVPVWPVMTAAICCEAICKVIKVKPVLFPRRVQFFTKNRLYDTSKATRLLGFEHTTTIEQGIEKTLAWYKKEGLI